MAAQYTGHVLGIDKSNIVCCNLRLLQDNDHLLVVLFSLGFLSRSPSFTSPRTARARCGTSLKGRSHSFLSCDHNNCPIRLQYGIDMVDYAHLSTAWGVRSLITNLFILPILLMFFQVLKNFSLCPQLCYASHLTRFNSPNC